ncbi:MAG: tannase/feruloyl esterase family alpha/beta hydrolase [Caulobacteraceae bacterium]
MGLSAASTTPPIRRARGRSGRRRSTSPAGGLGPFFKRGGKLLLSHGWTDGLIPANNTVAFYQRLSAGLPAGQSKRRLRLFMVPGMNHCSGGEGPSSDTLAAIDQWASTGVAPRAPDRRSAAGPAAVGHVPAAVPLPAGRRLQGRRVHRPGGEFRLQGPGADEGAEGALAAPAAGRGDNRVENGAARGL